MQQMVNAILSLNPIISKKRTEDFSKIGFLNGASYELTMNYNKNVHLILQKLTSFK